MMIGDKIRDLRNQKRMSQTELSKILHVSQQTITKWETGRAEPSSGAVASLSKFFGVSADYLLGTGQTKSSSDKPLSKNQKLVAYSIDPDISDEERQDIIEMVKIAMKHRRRI